MKEIIGLLGLEIGATKPQLKKWRQRGGVPHKYRLQMTRVADRKGWPVSEGDFDFEPSLKSEKKRWRQRMARATQQAAA